MKEATTERNVRFVLYGCMLHRNSIAHEVYFAGNPILNSHFKPDETEAPVWRPRAETALKVPEVDIPA